MSLSTCNFRTLGLFKEKHGTVKLNQLITLGNELDSEDFSPILDDYQDGELNISGFNA